MRIGIDAMGGDQAPAEPVRGAVEALSLLSEDCRIVLVGDSLAIQKELESLGFAGDGIEVVHASQVVNMNEAPVEAIRSKPDSSLSLLVKLQADGQIDAGISAGNTGAFVAATQMHLRRLEGVRRPGITIITPTFHGSVAICDVGANVSCRPQHLHQYAIMASLYVSAVCGVKNPRVGLLSVGEEEAKGNELVKRARELLENDPNIRFLGNVEGRDIFGGVCDVVVCDGFVGNVVLKLMEGMAGAVAKTLLEELVEAMPDQIAKIQQVAQSIVSKYDFNEYGGAPLLGVAGISIICHGASDHHGIKNAVRAAADFSRYRVNEQITEWLSQRQETAHE